MSKRFSLKNLKLNYPLIALGIVALLGGTYYFIAPQPVKQTVTKRETGYRQADRANLERLIHEGTKHD